MSNDDQKPSINGLMPWLAEQFGTIQMAVGELRAQTSGNRQTVIEIYHQLTHRMDRIEDRIGQRRFSFLKHIPWFKIVLLAAGTLLVATGHLTVAELKSWVIHKLS